MWNFALVTNGSSFFYLFYGHRAVLLLRYCGFDTMLKSEKWYIKACEIKYKGLEES